MTFTRRQLLAMATVALGGRARGADGGSWSVRAAELRRETLGPPYEALKRHAIPKRSPADDDWLSAHPEPGQSFASYALGRPVRARGFNAFDIVILGQLGEAPLRVASVVVAYARAFFGVPVRSTL